MGGGGVRGEDTSDGLALYTHNVPLFMGSRVGLGVQFFSRAPARLFAAPSGRMLGMEGNPFKPDRWALLRAIFFGRDTNPRVQRTAWLAVCVAVLYLSATLFLILFALH